ncbi:hypothetical protein FEM48_Zijuj01G0210100 [Ziziphus jujuba var. spinosa]|uniref:Ubiquitin carboxyl-terminal hydrolase n=1 Tax=Ziziphus jujuba var. spinosa TaxID=714518 RepID=A0A978W3J2_ZIZJJ|nr:hypothetical protein FEM48_Zijuj01G0210100 [Ziziphus jujuba var. spinosa]
MVEPLDLLRSNLSRVRIPEPTNRIYKQECCVSFDTPRSEGGLFIDMNTFLAFGKDYVGWNYEKTGNPVYLHIKQTKKLAPEDRPSKKPTLLAIGVKCQHGIDGGFDNNEIEYEDAYSIVILPGYVTLPFPSVELPEKVFVSVSFFFFFFRIIYIFGVKRWHPKQEYYLPIILKVRLAVDAILRAEGAERKEQVAAWTADKKQVSAYAMNLQQIDNGIIIPPSGWKCAKCDKTENLWLNLTDGMILCGRRNWDGSGGNNHAIEHYKETRYPLAVKLGTITADLEGAGTVALISGMLLIQLLWLSDVFSYPEDDSVLDPLLAQHLAFFGIDFSSLQKTEMTTAERELDQNTNFDWNRIQESGQEVEPICGPGYTGLVNLGNSCYLAATMQAVFSTHSFYSRYYKNQNLKTAFEVAPADPTVDLNMQLTKLGHGLLSGKYSVPAVEGKDNANATTPTASAKQEGIPPRMFKAVIAASHPEFSTMRQQDALEFFLHFLDQVERVNSGKPEVDPARCFKFGIEDRISCSSGKVAYNRRLDYILSLNIPLHEATNKGELEAFQKLKAEKTSEGKEVSADEIVRPRVPLEACLASFSSPEEIHDFYSTALKAKTTAINLAHAEIYVYIDVPDIIDISHMRSKGLQPGEELLPEGVPAEEVESNKPVANEDIVSQLVSMGFSELHCQKAAINTSNSGVEEAMNWLLSHMDDPDIDAPISQGGHTVVDQSQLDMLISFGFQEEIARKALKASGGDIEKATDWIFNNPDASASSDMDATTSNTVPTADAGLPDGAGRYRLIGIVSHIGTSTQCGHYVAHIFKDGRWVIFNDDKVGASINPPKDMGYLYFFERLSN